MVVGVQQDCFSRFKAPFDDVGLQVTELVLTVMQHLSANTCVGAFRVPQQYCLCGASCRLFFSREGRRHDRDSTSKR